VKKFVRIGGYIILAGLVGFVALMIAFPHGW
jgi:hypothetical protein